jgi:hypothetical protein
MFRIRHGRVTSLTSAMLRVLRRMSEGHTLPVPPRPVNAYVVRANRVENEALYAFVRFSMKLIRREVIP